MGGYWATLFLRDLATSFGVNCLGDATAPGRKWDPGVHP